MASPAISTKIAVEGEKEYKAAVAGINAELKSMQSALKLVESEFQNQQNSTAALEAKLKALNDVQAQLATKATSLANAIQNAKTAQGKWTTDIVVAEAKLKAATKALDDYKASGENDAQKLKELEKAQADAQKELDKATASYAAAGRAVSNWETQLNNTKIAQNDNNASIELTKKYLDEAKDSTDGCAKSINEFGERLDTTKSSADELADALAASGIANAMQTIVDAVKECVTAYAEFEEGMAGVQRTTGMSSEEIEVLGEEFKDMATYMPITSTELASIATTAGQLGIANENIESFTTVMAELATTTDLTADEAATMLAQFANITQMDPSNYERLGSTLAALGDSSATTASRITTMSEGIAATASISGMSEKEILAIATAVGSVGVEAGMGSTAINTFLGNINKAVQSGGDDLEAFAEVAGMTSGQFKAAWEYDAAGAFATLIEKIGESDNATQVLNDLGISAARQTRVILSLANSGDTLADSLDLANEAWEENTALGDKAAVMWSTVSASLTETKSSINNLKISLGDSIAPLLEPAIEKFQDFVDGLTDFVEEHPKIAAACTAVATGLAEVVAAISTFSAVKKALSILGVGDAFRDAAAGVSLFVEAIGGIGAGVAALGAVGAVVAGVSYIANQTSEEKLVENGTITQTEGDVIHGRSSATDDGVEAQQELVYGVQDKLVDLYAQKAAAEEIGGDTLEIDHEIAEAEAELSEAQVELSNRQHEAAMATEDQVAALEELGYTSEEASEMTQEQAAAIYDAQTALEAYTAAYQENWDTAREAIEGATGLFGSLEADADAAGMSMSDMEAAWAAQVDSINQYKDNLDTLAEYGIDTDFLTELSDGSAESVGYVQSLVGELDTLSASGGDVKGTVDEFNAAFQETSTAKDAFADTCAGIETDTDTVVSTVQGTLETLPNGMYDVGATVISNIQAGLDDNSNALYLKVQSIVNSAIVAANTAAGGTGSGTTGTGLAGTAAGGTDSAKRGVYLVGEEGPELVFMQGGEAVVDAVKTAALMNQASTASLMQTAATNAQTQNNNYYGSTSINVYGREGQSAKEIAQNVADILNSNTMRRMAVTA